MSEEQEQEYNEMYSSDDLENPILPADVGMGVYRDEEYDYGSAEDYDYDSMQEDYDIDSAENDNSDDNSPEDVNECKPKND